MIQCFVDQGGALRDPFTTHRAPGATGNIMESRHEIAHKKLSPEIRALWALLMGHFAGHKATCECCDMLRSTPEDDARREEILDIFRNMGFREQIDSTIREITAGYESARRKGNHYGWPYKTPPLVDPQILVAILEAAPRVLEKNGELLEKP